MSLPFISIIIPVHNGSDSLGSCLESISKSTYVNFECIVVDDHSTDNTARTAQSYDAIVICLERQRGAAHARNRGAEVARGDILLFVDADVEMYSDSLDRVAKGFNEHLEISALFGSYDDQPGKLNFISQYKNLFHHYIHQNAAEDASTFWTGCGAVKRDAFYNVGKFNEQTRMMEDIELGYKLKANGYRILLMKELTVKHWKHYSFLGLLKSEIFDRAIPWTVLMLDNREYTSDLNLKINDKVSALISILLAACAVLTTQSAMFIKGFPFLLGIYFLLNYRLYGFFIRKRGYGFALGVIPFHLLYYLYSTVGFVLGTCKYVLDKYNGR